MTPFLHTRFTRFTLLALTYILVLSPVIAEQDSVETQQLQQKAGVHLGGEFLRVSRAVFQSEPLTVDSISAGVALVELAANLAGRSTGAALAAAGNIPMDIAGTGNIPMDNGFSAAAAGSGSSRDSGTFGRDVI